MHLYLSHII